MTEQMSGKQMQTNAAVALLRSASSKLRALAGEASVGPWRDMGEVDEGDGFPFHMILNGAAGMDEHGVLTTFALNPRRSPDAAWVTAVSPHIAEPLAHLLSQLVIHAQIEPDMVEVQAALPLCHALLDGGAS